MLGDALGEQAIAAHISDPTEGFLAVYHLTPEGTGDLQSEDGFTVDDGNDLVPWDATDNLGMWLFDGASGASSFGVWYVDADMPDQTAVAALRYEDASDGEVTLLNAPVWSWNGAGAPDIPEGTHITVWYVPGGGDAE
jgi:hypothetical protein